MSSPSSDFSLTRMFLPKPIGALSKEWIGGTMTAWDAVTYTNTVVVGPTIYTNLPVVSPNGLTQGPVMLARTAAGLVVIGMIARAGGPTLDLLRYRLLQTDLTSTGTTLADAGALNFLLNSWTQYGLDGVLFIDAPSGDVKFSFNAPVNTSTRWTVTGSSPATSGTSGNIEVGVNETFGAGTVHVVAGAGAGIPSHCRPVANFATGDTPGLLQLRWAQNTAGGTSYLRAGSWLRCSELALAGDTATEIKQYTATGSRSYDTNGDPIGGTDGDNNCYQGIVSARGFGNEKSIIIFPGSTIRSELGSATILSARLYLYCFSSESAFGSFAGRAEPNSTVPATYNSGSAEITLNSHWPVPGWASVQCVEFVNSILAGDNAIGLTERVLSTYPTAFRGYGFGSSTRPYLEISYTP